MNIANFLFISCQTLYQNIHIIKSIADHIYNDFITLILSCFKYIQMILNVYQLKH